MLMMTPSEKIVEEKYRKLQIEHSELKDKYDLLCFKLKRNANEDRNTDNGNFLTNYGKDGRGYWE
jgi:hypothetical protein